MVLDLLTGDHAVLGGATLGCFFLLLGHAGFALYESGLSRTKNASNAMAMNALVWALSAIGFFITGFAFMCGGADPAAGLDRWIIRISDWGILGGKGFFFSNLAGNPLIVFLFFAMMCRTTITATIPTGALAERWRFKTFFIFSLLVGALIAPVYGSWVWGGGWIAQLGPKLGWGHGGVDYAGSSVVHMQGGVIALACAWSLGPRSGKFDARGHPRPILGHNIPMAVLGCLITGVALLALNTLPSLASSDGRIAIVATNSVLAAAAGAVAACLYMAWRFAKPDPTMMCNGMLAGLVAISASCAFVQPGVAVVIGALAGVITIGSVSFWEARGIDDPCGVVSVHGVGGLWGLLALGLFADGTYGEGYNGVTGSAVSGLFYGNSKQLLAQAVMGIACLAWGFCTAALAFRLVGRLAGPNRVAQEIESSGLDISELGVPAYRELLSSVSSGTSAAAVPRPAASPAIAGKSRFSIVIEGVDSATLISVWSGLCQVGSAPPSADFTQVYPHLTTVTGNRFRFNGGDPAKIKESLRRLFAEMLPDKSVSSKIES